MGVRGFEEDIIENWAVGVITTITKDRLPDGAVSGAKNSQFFNIGPQQSVYGTRFGCELQNNDVSTADSPIVAQYGLETDTGAFHLLVDGDGDLHKLVSGIIGDIQTTLFTDVSGKFSWATENNYAFVVNGTDRFKTNGEDVYKFGISQPGNGDWSISAGSGGSNLQADTYDVKIAYYNSSTGQTGPVSEEKTVTTSAGQKITATLPDATTIDDPQVDYIKIFIRQQSTMSLLFLVVDGASPAITDTKGWAVGTSSVDLDISNDQFSAFITLAPDVNENYPPPTNSCYLAVHKQRMFVADSNHNLYWSGVDSPEAFNTVDDFIPIGVNGEKITGLRVYGDQLLIFKNNKYYALVGDSPDTWVVRLQNNTYGCTANDSIGEADGKLYWMTLKGPVALSGDGLSDITTELIGPNFDNTHIDPDDLANAVVIVHTPQNYIAWAVTPVGESRNTTIIPFNFKLSCWMASEWNMVDVNSAALVPDSTGRIWPYIGDYDGWVYKVGVGVVDGLPSGTVVQSTVTSSTNNTLTDSSAAWTVDQLKGKYVYVWGADGLTGVQRKRITSNTSTELTLASNWTTNPTVGNNYTLAGVFMDWRSAFRTGKAPFFKKRIEFIFLQTSSTSAAPYTLNVYKDLDEDNPVISRDLFTGSGAIFDVSLFDEAFFSLTGLDNRRIPVRTTGFSWQTRIMHMGTGEQLLILRLAGQWLSKTKKVGRSAAAA